MTIKKISKEDACLRIADLALAGAIALFFPLEKIERPEIGSRAFFVFKRSKEVDELVDRYWKQELKVEPQAYFQQLRAIKARLYQ